MKLKIPPCKKCPYKLGKVQTLVNPCPDCKVKGYNMNDLFSKSILQKI